MPDVAPCAAAAPTIPGTAEAPDLSGHTADHAETAPPRSSLLLPALAALGAVTLWGLSFPAMKVAVQALGPMPLMWARMMVALTLLAPFATRLFPSRSVVVAPSGTMVRSGFWNGVPRRHKLLLLPTVLLQPCLYFLCESNAMQLTSASQAGVISASVPLLVGAGAWLFLGERPSPRLWLGVVFSCGGVAWLTLSGGAGTESAPDPLLGNILELLAMVCAAGNMVLVRRLSAHEGHGGHGRFRWNPWTLTALQTVAGALFFAPGAYAVLTGAGQWPADVLLAVLYLGAGSSLGAFGLFNWATSHLPASSVGAFINLVPVAAVGFGWLWLGETLNATQMLAAAVVMVGVALGTGRRR
ncbi:MAG TPA: DMT family transporter [Nitratidesulfovibrio sp.]|nr:DMT family transporter [Nitratidesulfovibrio sp.]